MSRAWQALVGAPPVTGYEADLVQGLKERSPEAWADVYVSHHERLWRYAVGRLGSREEAEDIASQVFLRALNGIDSYRPAGKPVIAWLYGITQNVIREHYRSKDRKQDRPDSAAKTGDPADTNAGPDIAQLLDLRAALRVLTPKQREVITLVHLGGFSAREVATMLGRTERSVYYLEARALIRLRDELSARDGDTREKR